MILVVETHISN